MLLKLYAKNVCALHATPSDTLPLMGTWKYVCDEDMCYVELRLAGDPGIQLYGSPEDFSSNMPLCSIRKKVK